MGTALKTVSLRITSTSAELEQLGEDTDYACDTMSDYRDLVMGLTHNKVDIIGDDGEYKSTYDILKGISGVWEEMNSMEQSSLMKSLFGARQANIGAAILENFDIAESSLDAALNSDGSAQQELSRYQDSIAYSISTAKASFQELSQSVFSSDFLKAGADLGSSLMSGLSTTINSVGMDKLLLGGLGLYQTSKGSGKSFIQSYDFS